MELTGRRPRSTDHRAAVRVSHSLPLVIVALVGRSGSGAGSENDGA